MNLKLENSLVVLSQRKKEQGLPQRPTKKERNQELTQEERLLQHYQEQISQMHESNFQQELQAKLDSGQELTPEEEQYLEKVNPDALKEHEKLKEEVAAYRKQLQNCRTKKDVEKLKLYKMGQFMSEVKTVSNDPHIPKAKKKAMLEQILKRTYAIEKEHNDYTKTPEYQTKPDKEPYEDVSPADKDKSSADSTDATTSDSTDNAEISSGSDSAEESVGAADDELMDVCKEFEAYFLEQVYKEMKKTIPENEDQDASMSQMTDYFEDEMIQKLASQSVEQSGGSNSLAQQLYEQMKRNYNME